MERGRGFSSVPEGGGRGVFPAGCFSNGGERQEGAFPARGGDPTLEDDDKGKKKKLNRTVRRELSGLFDSPIGPLV